MNEPWTVIKKINRVFYFFILLIIVTDPVIAAPSGADLLSACDKSIELGFDAIEGQMCTWYALPCNCYPDDEVTQVCLPDDLSMESIAQIIVDGLKNETQLQTLSASESATLILARIYPCQEVK